MKKKKYRKHNRAHSKPSSSQVEHIEVGVTGEILPRLNNSGQFGISAHNPSTKRYESENNNSREDRTNRFSSKVSRDDVPKSSILIDVNESIEFKDSAKGPHPLTGEIEDRGPSDSMVSPTNKKLLVSSGDSAVKQVVSEA